MKKLFLGALFTFSLGFAMAQSQTWKALEDYHEVMAKTFHPSEEGNLAPIKARSGELAQKAQALKKSAIPAAYQKPGVKETLALLAKESKALDKLVHKKKTTDEAITKSLAALHDRFHEVMEKCSH